MTASKGEVLIVGAGVFGAAAALELRGRGYGVVLLDRGPAPRIDASSTDVSKMIRMDYGADVFYHELAEAAIEGWEGWNAQWPRRLYHDEGFLVLSSGPMRPGGFEYESHRVLVERGYRPERLDGAELARRYPAWNASRYEGGYLSPRGGWAQSESVVAELLRQGTAAGVRFVSGTFIGLTSKGSRVSGARVLEGDPLEAGHVIVSAGAWTPVLLPWLAQLLEPVAQPVIHLGVEEPDAYRGERFPPFAADIAGTGWYGFPALEDGSVKVGHHGPGRVVHPDDRGEVAAAHVAAARAFLAESIPGLADGPVVRSRVCMYCDSFDGDLLIARDPEREGLVVASGGSGHAFKFAPVLGPLVADVVEGRPSRWAERFRWRYGGPARAEAARLKIRTATGAGP